MDATIFQRMALIALVAVSSAACAANGGQPAPARGSPAGEAEASPQAVPSPVDHGCTESFSANEDVADAVARATSILPTADERPEGPAYRGCDHRLANPYQALSVYDSEASAALAASGVLDDLVVGVEHFFGPNYIRGGMRATVLVFDDEASAAETVEALRPILLEQGRKVGDPLMPLEEVPAEGLGDGGFGLRGTNIPTEPDFDVIFYAWQHDDLVMSIWGWDRRGKANSAPQEEILEIAGMMHERAS